MTPASEIVKRLGGNKAVADFLGLERTAVQRWTYDPPNGLGERVPMRHWARIVQMGQEVGKPVALEELMPAEIVKVASAPKRRRAA
jgi:hypothetical protein